MRRTRMKRGRRRIGQSAAERRRAGGKKAAGRDSATQSEYDAMRQQIRERANGRCEVVLDGERCPRPGTEPCHAWNRSQGCPDSPDTVYWGCRFHNMQQAAAYSVGRLLVIPRGAGTFGFLVRFAKTKWEARACD